MLNQAEFLDALGYSSIEEMAADYQIFKTLGSMAARQDIERIIKSICTNDRADGASVRSSETTRLTDKNKRLSDENERLSNENERLSDENERLSDVINCLREAIRDLRSHLRQNIVPEAPKQVTTKKRQTRSESARTKRNSEEIN
ncbi:unnamed protein product [Clonostachys rosea f. rosea IK726]|uniref:Uncharacterized protein n=1 Tax=Clonostachys rosea f. rosea IK726 TaxID=1349383 RepID=A0ACA9TWN5_BIOOC|nr:unnamed protein product [Clonostachys rosea f. rosea IK726]